MGGIAALSIGNGIRRMHMYQCTYSSIQHIHRSIYLLVEPGGVRAAEVRHHRHEGDLAPARSFWFIFSVC